MLSRELRLAIVASAGVMCGIAAAQEPTKPAQPEEPPKPAVDAPTPDAVPPPRQVEWIVKVPAQLGFSAGLEDKPGAFTVSRAGLDLEVDIPVGAMGELDLGFAYERSRYDFSSTTSLIAGTTSPFQDINKETFRASFGKQQTRQLGWLVGGSVGFAAEDGGELGKAVVGGVYGGVGYYLSEHLKVGAALAVYSQLGKNPLILPVPTFNWEISDQWRLSTAGKPGLTLFYKPVEDWTLSLGAWYESRDFRLDKSGPVPGGIGRDSAVPVLLNAVFKPTKNLSIEAGVGVRLLQNISVDDSSGNGLVDANVNPAAFVSLQATFTF